MLVLSKVKVVWVLPPKSGTHTTIAALDEHFPDNRRGKRNRRGNVNEGIHAVQISSGLEDYTWVMNVRNPFTRAVSWWNHYRTQPNRKVNDRWYDHVKKLDTFDAAGRDHELCWGAANFWWRATLSYYWAMIPRIDHFVRVEHFHDDFNALPFVRAHGVEVENKHDFKGEYITGEWWKNYTPHMQEFVATLCAGDFQRLPVSMYEEKMVDSLSPDEYVAYLNHWGIDF